MDQQVPIMDWLRRETQEQHTRVEALPFFRVLAARELPLASYGGLLHALATVYAVFEQELMQAQHPRLVAVWDGALGKLPLIQRDLAALQLHRLPEMPAAELQAHLLAQHIRQRAHNEPVSLLGYLYVLDGSTLGGMVVQAQVARAFGLRRSTGLAYLSSYGTATKAHWTTFSQRMNTALTDMAEQHRVVTAANEAFTGIAHLLNALYPLDISPRDRVRTI